MSAAALRPRIEALLAGMPPVAALGIEVARFEPHACTLTAPLAANINDKGCAFGGSLVSVMTLAGWALVNAWLAEHGHEADVYVADSTARYRVPVEADLAASAEFVEIPDITSVNAAFASRAKVSFLVRSCVRTPKGSVATRQEARYVAVPAQASTQV